MKSEEQPKGVKPKVETKTKNESAASGTKLSPSCPYIPPSSGPSGLPKPAFKAGDILRKSSETADTDTPEPKLSDGENFKIEVRRKGEKIIRSESRPEKKRKTRSGQEKETLEMPPEKRIRRDITASEAPAPRPTSSRPRSRSKSPRSSLPPGGLPGKYVRSRSPAREGYPSPPATYIHERSRSRSPPPETQTKLPYGYPQRHDHRSGSPSRAPHLEFDPRGPRASREFFPHFMGIHFDPRGRDPRGPPTFGGPPPGPPHDPRDSRVVPVSLSRAPAHPHLPHRLAHGGPSPVPPSHISISPRGGPPTSRGGVVPRLGPARGPAPSLPISFSSPPPFHRSLHPVPGAVRSPPPLST